MDTLLNTLTICILKLSEYFTSTNNIIFFILLAIAIYLGILLLKIFFVYIANNYIIKNKTIFLEQNKPLAKHCKYLESTLFEQASEFNTYINNMGLNQVYDCSSSVLSNAEKNPVKFLIKYSNLNADIFFLEQLDFCKDYLMLIDEFHESNARLKEKVKSQLPSFIRHFASDDKIVPIICDMNMQIYTIKHPVFCFSYVSPGGNSSRKYDIIITHALLKDVQSEIATKLNKLGHSKNQRSAMTNDLREAIKKRDNYTCCMCGNSVYNEPNLLLEVDHIIPISKGGKTEASNLQTLCWRCNRAKSNK